MRITVPLNQLFIVADHHFGHGNIIKFCHRTFESVQEMDDTMIREWNKIVGPDDIVIYLADFCLGDQESANYYLQQLNGCIEILCNWWHHDKRWLPRHKHKNIRSRYHKVEWLEPLVVLEVPELGRNSYPLAITLCHYPLAVWDRKHFSAWHLHGHLHGQYSYPDGELAFDVGVDSIYKHFGQYRPVNLIEIAEIMQQKQEM